MASIEQQMYDKLMSLSVDIQRAGSSVQSNVIKEMKKLEKTLVSLVKDYDPTSYVRTASQQKQLERMLADTRDTIKQSYKNIRDVVDGDIVNIASTTSAGVAASINIPAGATLFSNVLTKDVAREIASNTLIEGAKSADWWSRQAGNLTFNFTNQMREALTNGESIGDMVRRIRGHWDAATGTYIGGIMNINTRNAAALARTSALTVSNQARLRTLEENSDVVKGIEWVSALDSRTSEICRGLDGLVWDLEKKPIGHKKKWPGPTAHWNCRSTQIPVLKNNDKLPKSKQKIGEGRLSKTGELGPNKTYDDWLRRQKKSVQIDVLGKQKYDLYKANKLSVRDLTNFDNRPLTIAELEAKYGAVAKSKKTLTLPKPLTRKSKAPTTIAGLKKKFDKTLKDVSQFGPQDRHTFSINSKGFRGGLTKLENKAFRNYISSGYKSMNAIMRGKSLSHLTKTDISYYEKLSKTLRDLIGSGKYTTRTDTIVYRGLRSKRIHQAGDVIKTKGLISTSTDRYVSKSFANSGKGTLYEIFIPKGTPAIPGHSGELEIIFNHESEYMVIGKSKSGVYQMVKIK